MVINRQINKYLKCLLIVLLSTLATFNYVSLPLLACGPFFPEAYFSYYNHPDLPLRNFAQGKLGILQPTFAPSYLVIAYRYLTHNPLSTSEQNAALNLWHKRLAYPTDADNKTFAPWLSVRNQIPGIKKLEPYDLSTQRQIIYSDPRSSTDTSNSSTSTSNTIQYPICSPDAFIHASNTLKQFISKYGADSSQTKFWIANQDKVFQNCNWLNKNTVVLPIMPAKSSDTFIYSAYLYQLASSYFYAGFFSEANKYFAQLAANKSFSSYKLASYLVARTRVQALIATGKVTPENKNVQDTEQYLLALLKNPSLVKYRSDIDQLIKSLQYILYPQKCCKQLADSLSKDNTSTFYAKLDDYTTILYSLTNVDNPSISPPPSLTSVRLNDLTDWLLSFSNLNQNKKHILQKWHETKSTPWLIAALAASRTNTNVTASKTTVNDSDQTKALITAANNLSPSSPGYLTAQYYAILLLNSAKSTASSRAINTKDKILATEKLDYLLKPVSPNMTASAHNLLLAERQKLSDTRSEYIYFALKKPVSEIADPSYRLIPDDFDQIEQKGYSQKKKPATFDGKMAETLNSELPLCLWVELAHNKELPSELRGQIIAAAWTRAILLNQTDIARALSPQLSTSYPAIKTLIQSYQSATDPVERKFAACYILLQAPGMSPYISGGAGRDPSNILERSEYGDNFWIPADPQNKSQIKNINNQDPAGQDTISNDIADDRAVIAANISPYLSQVEKEKAKTEIKSLYTAASPAHFFYESTINWIKINPNDPRIPAALYRIVKIPRWTNHTIPNSSQYSKKAYLLLKQKYGNSKWANQTTYWY